MARVVAQVKSELNSWLTSLGAGEVSREFFELIKAIGEARSKQEEHTIIDQESKTLKVQLKHGQGVSQDDPRLIRELLVRLIYCEMLGIQVPFGYMVALNLMQMRARLIDKRVGYLAASLFLNRDHELVTLCINSWRRDLQSQSHVEQDMALTAMGQLLSAEAIPAVLPELLKCSTHLEASVRKKSVVVLHRVLQIEPSHALERDVSDALRRTLCDHEPSVMAATLSVYATLAQRARKDEDEELLGTYRELVPSLVSILKQVIEHALSREYDYQHVPAPWLQVRLLALLADLCAGVRGSSEHAYSIVLETLRRAEQLPVNAARAVQYSCVLCIARLFPNSALLDAAAHAVSALLSDKERNVRYLGLKALLALVEVNPAYALQHQRSVIECLSDPDETLQRVTLRLLHAMANPSNVAVVAERFLEHLRKSSDDYVRRDLVAKLTSIAEQFAPDNAWFIATLVKVFVLGGALVAPAVAYNLLVLIAEGSTGGEDESADQALRRDAVQQLLRIAQRPQVQARAAILTQVSAWLMGEYAYVLHAERDAVDVCCDLLERVHEDEHVRVWLLAALAKLTAQIGETPAPVRAALDKYLHSHNVELQQRACELRTLVAEPEARGLLRTLLPVDASTRDAAVDPQLPFLDEWIRAQVSSGRVPSRAYQPPRDSVLTRARINSASAPKRALNYVYKAANPMAATAGAGPRSNATSIYEQDSGSSSSSMSTSSSSSNGSSSMATLSSGGGGWGAGGWANANANANARSAPLRHTSAEPSSASSVLTSIPLSKPLGAPAPSSSSLSAAPKAASSPSTTSISTSTPLATTSLSHADERLAASLFGSVSSSGAGAGRGGGSGAGVRGGPAHGRAVGASSSAVPKTPFNSVTRSSGSQEVAPQAYPSLIDVPSPHMSLLDTSPSPSTSTSTSAQSSLPMSSVPLLMSEEGVWLQISPGDDFDASNLRLPDPVSSLIRTSGSTPSSHRVLSSSSELLVHARLCLTSDATLLLLCLSNRLDAALAEMALTFSSHAAVTLSVPQDALSRSLQHVGTHVSATSAHALRLSVRSLPGRATVACLVALHAREPLTQAQLSLTLAGSLTFASELRVQHVRGTASLSALDFVRPRVLDLATYGKQWPLHTKEQKLSLALPAASSEELAAYLVAQWHVHVVSLKGAELVASASVLHSSLSAEQSSVLLYVKLGQAQTQGQLTMIPVALSVRALDARLADTLATAMRTRL